MLERVVAQLGLQEGKTDCPDKVDTYGCLHLYQHPGGCFFQLGSTQIKTTVLPFPDVHSRGKKTALASL